MEYAKEIIFATEKALIKELGELSKNASRGLARGQAIKNALMRMNEKISAAREIGITSATPLDEEKINVLFKYIEPLAAFSFQNDEMRSIICQEIADYFSAVAKLEEKYLSEVYFSPRKKVTK